MFWNLSAWSRFLRHLRGPRRRTASPARKPRPRVCLGFDVLEQRQLPTPVATLTGAANPASPDGIGLGSYTVSLDSYPMPPNAASVVVDINRGAGEGVSADDTHITINVPSGLLRATGTFTMNDDQSVTVSLYSATNITSSE